MSSLRQAIIESAASTDAELAALLPLTPEERASIRTRATMSAALLEGEVALTAKHFGKRLTGEARMTLVRALEKAREARKTSEALR